MSYTHFKVDEALGLGGEYGQEVHWVREIFVSAGRVLGLLLIWAVPQTNVGAVVVLLFLTLINLIDAFIIKKIEKDL